MEKKGTQIKKPERKQYPVIIDSGKFGIYLSLSLVFIISFLYFLIFGKHIFSYQNNLTLFVYSREYLNQFVSKPGGLLEYTGNFISQFYFNPIPGSLIISSLFTLIAYVFLKIAEGIYKNGLFLTTLMVLPSCILMILQADFNYQLHYTLGFLAASVYLLLVIKSRNRILYLILLALFPVFYYLTGGFIWIFTGMYILFGLLHKNIIYPLVLIAIASLTLFVFNEYLFYQPLGELAYYPLPQRSYFKIPVALYSVFGLFILYPILLSALRTVRITSENVRALSLYVVVISFSVTIFVLSKKYDREITNLFKLENLVYQEKWRDVIKFQEKIQSGNIIAQYYYNLALSETDQLCDRMFFGPQDFGPGSLMVQWDSKANINQIFRGAYFFYNIGLINEAHRWAFESMVMQGYRPENIKMLIKTELINGHYRVAEKYINVLKRTFRFRNLAKEYEKMLKNPELILNDPDMGKKMSQLSGQDFLIRLKDQQANVLLLLQSNPNNIKAFEYMIAWFMLERNVGKVADEIKKMSDMGYVRIPRHIEEAALIFKSVAGVSPDFGGLKISPETEKRYLQFLSVAGKLESMTSSGKANMPKALENTFWYYNEFK